MRQYLAGHPQELVWLVLLLFLTAASLIASAGYKKIAIRIVFSLIVSFVGGWVLAVAALFLGLMIEPKGEWAGIASVLLAWIIGLSSGVLLFLFLVWKWIYRPRKVLPKDEKSYLFAIIGFAGLVFLTVSIRSYFPSTHSDAKLASMVLSGMDSHGKINAQAELIARGREAAPEMIEALHHYPAERSRQYESAQNNGLRTSLVVLGKIDGKDAVQELRSWLHGSAAPDIRAAAARGLAEAGDRESAYAIALLLREKSYEWRKQRPVLYIALSMLKDDRTLPEIRAALMEEETSLYLGDGTRCLLEFGTPEAQKIMLELGASKNQPMRLAVAGGLASAQRDPQFTRLLLHLLEDSDQQVRWTSCGSLFGASRSSAKYPEVWDSFEYGPCSGIDGPEWKTKVEKIHAIIKFPDQ